MYLQKINDIPVALLSVSGTNIRIQLLVNGRVNGVPTFAKTHRAGNSDINVGHLSDKWADGDTKRTALGILKMNPEPPLPAYHQAGQTAYAPNADGLTCDKIVEAIPFSLDDLRNAKHTEISKAYEEAISVITAKYPPSEIATWPIQREQALAYNADSVTTNVGYIQGLANQKGITLAEQVARIIPKVRAHEATSSSILGKRQALDDQIDIPVDPENPGATYDAITAIAWG